MESLRKLHQLCFCTSLAAVILCGCRAATQTAAAEQSSHAAQPIPDDQVAAFIPRGAQLVKRLNVAFANREGVVLAYTMRNENNPIGYDIGIRVAQRDAAARWAIVYDEKNPMGSGGSDPPSLEKVVSPDGKEAVVVILTSSGAGTTTDWHIVAAIHGNLIVMDPNSIRSNVLKQRGYVFQGYNSVSVRRDTVIERLPGYSPGRARCCPDKPTIDLAIQFTGSSLRLVSVKQIGIHDSGN